MTATEVLKKYWGYNSFRAPQDEIIQAVVERKDVLAILPTGGGKSICFQVPAMMQEGLCIVVTPLIALMQDQVAQLKKNGIPAIAIHSGLSYSEIDLLLDNCVYGQQKFLYVSPERLLTELFRVRFQKMNVCLIAIDEAHCISQWGYDFRPPYLQIAELRELKPDVPFIALTASATEQVRQDIMAKLLFRNPSVFQISFARKNFSLVVRNTEAKEKKLVEILTKVPGTAIVYVRSRKSTQTIAQYLQRNRISATFYHAGLHFDERTTRQREWLNDSFRVMVATNAFGMGINKSDVRTVIHMDLPENLESYYQEAGRAGRDGKQAYATILFHPTDAESLQSKAEQAYPTFDYLKKIYQALANHFQIAIHAGQGESYDFDIEQFAKKFSLKPSAIYPALKRLEEAGLVQFSESFYHPSRLHFTADKLKLYEFQVAHARFDPIIKMLLRLYGGELYADFVQISESQLATALKISFAEVQLVLQQLHQLQLLIYSPMRDSPQVTFVIPRQDEHLLVVDKFKLENRRKLNLEKTARMIQYAEQDTLCRMLFIQDYFNETSEQTCGVCDVCYARKKRTHQTAIKLFEEQIRFFLAKQPLSPESLVEAAAPDDEELFLEAVREMVENAQLFYDEHWLLNLKK